MIKIGTVISEFTQSFQNLRSKFSLHMFPHNGETSTAGRGDVSLTKRARLGPQNHIHKDLSCHRLSAQVPSNDPKYLHSTVTSKLKHLLPGVINLSCRSDHIFIYPEPQ